MTNQLKVFIGVLLLWWLYVSEMSTHECFSCSGINCQRPSRVNVTTPCVDQWDNCITIFNGFTVVERGCYSFIAESQRPKCDDPFNRECLSCFGDRCNNKANAKCIQCNSKDHSNCLAQPEAVTPTHCPIPTSANTYCYIRSDHRNNLERGCLNDVVRQLECLKDPLCHMCLPLSDFPCNDQFKISGSPRTTNCVLLTLAALVLQIIVVN